MFRTSLFYISFYIQIHLFCNSSAERLEEPVSLVERLSVLRKERTLIPHRDSDPSEGAVELVQLPLDYPSLQLLHALRRGRAVDLVMNHVLKKATAYG